MYPSRKEPKMTTTEPKKPKITWDEEVIAEHDKLRGTRMKIDEPDTPFAYLEDDGAELADDVDDADADDTIVLSAVRLGGAHLVGRGAGDGEARLEQRLLRGRVGRGEARAPPVVADRAPRERLRRRAVVDLRGRRDAPHVHLRCSHISRDAPRSCCGGRATT